MDINGICYTYPMRFKAILFDMDGVIVDSEPAHEKAFITVLNRHNIPMSSDDYTEFFSGKPGPQALKDFMDARGIQDNVDIIISDKEDWYLDHAFDTISGYSATIEFIKHNLPPLPYGLVTSSIRRVTLPTLRKYDIYESFSTIVTLDDIKNGKPNPEGYLLAAQNLNVSPTKCAVIEDSPSGVAAAKAAGMHCIALTTTHSYDQLLEADVITDRLTDDMFV